MTIQNKTLFYVQVARAFEAYAAGRFTSEQLAERVRQSLHETMHHLPDGTTSVGGMSFGADDTMRVPPIVSDPSGA